MREIKLNAAQQAAVDHIYGPLLVLAGPGTGKTQLLSARIAHILTKTDAAPQNILCLTFTEAAAQNMRERLAGIIKDEAYDVHINTYHGFGSDIIRSYPEFFEEIDLETGKDARLERPIDDLQRIQIVTGLIQSLPYSSPLIGARHYIKNVSSTISELKRALYTPESLRSLADENLAQVQSLSPKISAHIGEIKSFPRTADKAIELFSGIADILADHDGLAAQAYEELQEAMAEAVESNKSAPLTAWKNTWLTKDSSNNYRFTDEEQHLRIRELATIFEKYQYTLEEQQLYDFDDMILRTIDALEHKDELRFNLQEKYQFILLDEFQDTNAAQFELVKKLADNPVHEGQPNIFAVGDDDQAIYAFQGARVSNMLGFKQAFRDVKIVNLTENYRSHPDILHTAHQVATQIESRLHHDLDGVEKTLTASSNQLPKDAHIERHEFSGQANEYAWVAHKAKLLIAAGVNANEISILAPKHALLEGIVPFLAKQDIPVSYEKREDILHTPLVRAIRTMSELVIASSKQDEVKMNELLPQILSFDFYQIPVKEIWQVNWSLRTQEKNRSWAKQALENEALATHVLFFLTLGNKVAHEPLEYMLDFLIGSVPLQLDGNTSYISPLKSYYFSTLEDPSKHQSIRYYEMLANLSTIREHIRAHQTTTDHILTLQDFLDFITAYEIAEQPLINTHPVAQSQQSVQLMTVYKAKGLEFEHVFLLSVHDDVWGKKARSNTNKLSLPANLQHIRYMGSSEDELRRILFVAITRAKHGLYLTSHALKDSGKPTEPVKYLLEYEDESSRKTSVLPDKNQEVVHTDYTSTETMHHVEILWESRHLDLTADLKSLLRPRLDTYQMSPTHLNSYIDLEHGGPQKFLLQTLLRFPQAPGVDGEFGTAIHTTLDWYQHKLSEGHKPTLSNTLQEFDAVLAKRYIPLDRLSDFQARGHQALSTYLAASGDMFARQAQSEVDFRNEGVLLGTAHLSGKIDRLEIDSQHKTVSIVDFKTGKPHEKWENTIKLLKYKQQLYFYKFLIEGSHSWAGYRVDEARLEFVEPNQQGKTVEPLKISFDEAEENEMKQLIAAVWDAIQQVEFPDTNSYSHDYKGTNNFIQSLLRSI